MIELRTAVATSRPVTGIGLAGLAQRKKYSPRNYNPQTKAMGQNRNQQQYVRRTSKIFHKNSRVYLQKRWSRASQLATQSSRGEVVTT